MHSFSLSSSKKVEALDITEKVSSVVGGGAICTVYVPHTTAAVLVNEFEPNLKQDIEELFSEIVPEVTYRHDRIDNNARAHLSASLAGTSVSIPLEGNHLALGTWQRVIFLELDGPRERKVCVQVV
ncbi:YjbQ family protein [Candidatus Micrarchaeota archaeon]|nr:YjbQ family protein [Candidatus Micrarchaeota archaeon]